jgi:hypothetical protein
MVHRHTGGELHMLVGLAAIGLGERLAAKIRFARAPILQR